VDAILEPRAVGDVTGAFFVPGYQRGYRWGPDEVDRLLADIWESNGAPYYLQPVVVKQMADGRWELIDGQQRFTTLYLIFQYMRDQGLQSAGAGYSIEYETRPGSQEFLRSPMADHKDENIDFHHIFGAYERIRSWFEAWEHRTQHVANKFYGYLFDSVKVIWYEASQDLDSITLFTRLNVGRIPLTDAELVKALVLANSRARPGYSDKSEQIAAQWDQFERELRAPEVWSFITGRHESEATHIGLVLDTLADQIGGRPSGRHRPRYYTFETLRNEITAGAQAFWDRVVKLHSLILGWYDDRQVFHKVGFLIQVGSDTFGRLVNLADGLTKPQLHAALDGRIRDVLDLTEEDLGALDYDTRSAKCSEVLLLMNVETVRARKDDTARYSFNAHSRGSWSLEHIHAQNAKELRRDEKIWREWLLLQRDVVEDLPTLESAVRAELLSEIDDVLGMIAEQQVHGVGVRFDAVKAAVEDALTDESTRRGENVHSLANLALLASGDNSALSNSTFEVKRREILARDKAGSYIPPCTRNVFLKYYTDADDQQIHFWGAADRESYLKAILEAVAPYLQTSEVAA
jgi:hypothetical protein